MCISISGEVFRGRFCNLHATNRATQVFVVVVSITITIIVKQILTKYIFLSGIGFWNDPLNLTS